MVSSGSLNNDFRWVNIWLCLSSGMLLAHDPSSGDSEGGAGTRGREQETQRSWIWVPAIIQLQNFTFVSSRSGKEQIYLNHSCWTVFVCTVLWYFFFFSMRTFFCICTLDHCSYTFILKGEKILKVMPIRLVLLLCSANSTRGLKF